MFVTVTPNAALDKTLDVANFQLGRDKQGGDAIALLYVDAAVDDVVLGKLTAHPAIRQAKPLTFNVD